MTDQSETAIEYESEPDMESGCREEARVLAARVRSFGQEASMFLSDRLSRGLQDIEDWLEAFANGR